ncbi:hypothetical protein EV361DRAFT_1034756 [Lentinula raphanica]|nr:hypothetical protein F5880DRAFT_1602280 [Lentinula raphanica]KAJ3969919.1 hypothetical protein EV361DRAFT_1034756 [Lentinula raphanica]
MASALFMFSFALFFFLPTLGLFLSLQCTFKSRNLFSILGIATLGFLGIAQALTGLLGTSTGAFISSAILDGVSGMTTNALLVSTIYRIGQHRESPIIPNVNLALYAISMALFVICGVVLSLIRRVSSLLGPVFLLLFASTALPLLAYMFFTTTPSSLASDDDFYNAMEDIQSPKTPTTPMHQVHNLNIPLSPSFLSLSSTPPSPASHRSTPITNKRASLKILSTHVHPIQQKSVTIVSNKLNLRPATSPSSSREKKLRPRPTPLVLSRHVEANARSPLTSSNRQRHRLPTCCSNDVTSRTRNSPRSVTSTARRIWLFLLGAQVSTLMTEGLRLCIQVVLPGDTDQGVKPFGTALMEILQNLFLVVQAGCVMYALMSYNHFVVVLKDGGRPSPISINVTSASPPLPDVTNRPMIFAHDSNLPEPLTADTHCTNTTYCLTSMPVRPFYNEQENENLTRLDRDLEKGLCTLFSNRDTNLEALDLAIPLTPVSDSGLALKPVKMHYRRCELLSIRVQENVNVHYNKVAPLITDRDRLESNSRSLNTLEFGLSPQLIPTTVAEAEASEAADKSISTVIFPTRISTQMEKLQITDKENHQPTSDQLSPSLRSKKESLGSKSSRSLRYGRIPSIPSLSSLSSSLAKSRLRNFSLTGKISRRTQSTATASMMDWGSERRHQPSASLSRSSSFCSPRPKRRALPSDVGEVRPHLPHTCNLDRKQRQNDTQGYEDPYSSRMRRPDALFADTRTLSPLPFASYSENTSPINDSLQPTQKQERPPLRPTRSSTFHIFPNFDALAGLGSLGAKLGRGLGGGRSPSPMPTRMLSTETGEGLIGMRSPTPRSMGGIIEMSRAAVSGAARSPSRLGLDLFRMEGPSYVKEPPERAKVERVDDEELISSSQVEMMGNRWNCVISDPAEDRPTYDVELQELRTPKKPGPAKEDRLPPSPSRIPRLKRTKILDSPVSLKSISSWESETTPTSIGLQTPRTPTTPFYEYSRVLKPPYSIPSNTKSRSSPLTTGKFSNKLALTPPPTSFTISSRSSSKATCLPDGPTEVFNHDPDPFAGPELGAIVRDSQVSLLREDSDRASNGQAQTATRMAAWGNLTLPVPKEKRSPGVGLRRAVDDDGMRDASNPSILLSKSYVNAGSNSPHIANAHLDTSSANANEPRLQQSSSTSSSSRKDGQGQSRHRDSRGSISHVPVEEALLAERLLHKLNRRAEGRKGGKRKGGARVQNSREVDAGPVVRETNSSGSGGGKSFLLGMAKTKFLGYGRSL